MQRLPIEPISQASANQRAGPLRPGRRRHLHPAVLRGGLRRPAASSPSPRSCAPTWLGDPADGRARPRRHRRLPVPRPARPAQRRATASSCSRSSARCDRRAATTRRRLTTIGRRLARAADRPAARPDGARGRAARLPARGAGHRRRAVDPGPARAARRAAGARPTSCTPASATRRSDFLACLNLWRYLREQQQELSARTRSAGCAARVPQLPAGPRVAGPPRPAPTGRARASGSTSGIPTTPARRPDPTSPAPGRSCWPACCRTSALDGRRGGRASTSARAAARFAICPGSALARKPPELVMAAELVETSRLWAGRSRAIDPAWAEPLAGHLVKRSYTEPHWSREARRGDGLRAGHAVRRADRRRTARSVRPDRPGAGPRAVHPPRPRRGRVGHPAPRSSQPTGSSLEEVEELEDRARRRDIAGRRRRRSSTSTTPGSGRGVVTGAHFDTWWSGARGASPTCSRSPRELLVPEGADAITGADYPDAGSRGR